MTKFFVLPNLMQKSEVAAKEGRLGMQVEKIGVVSNDQQLKLDVEKHSHQQQGRKESKNQCKMNIRTPRLTLRIFGFKNLNT